MDDLPVSALYELLSVWNREMAQHREIFKATPPFYASALSLNKGTTNYVKVMKSSFRPEFYKTPFSKRLMEMNYITFELLKVGKTSITQQTRVIDENEQSLMYHRVIEVLVDKATRRPAPVPQWYIDTYSRKDQKHVMYDLTEPDAIPDVARSLHFITREDHTDENGHITICVYVIQAETALHRLLKNVQGST